MLYNAPKISKNEHSDFRNDLMLNIFINSALLTLHEHGTPNNLHFNFFDNYYTSEILTFFFNLNTISSYIQVYGSIYREFFLCFMDMHSSSFSVSYRYIFVKLHLFMFKLPICVFSILIHYMSI